MKHIISLSGGVGSYFTLKRVLEKHDKKDVVAVFCDTLAEDGDLYRFLNDIEFNLDIEIKKLCKGKTPFGLAFENNFLFNSRVAKCSYELKSKVFMEWMKENYTYDECIVYIGIDFTEKHRCEAIVKNYLPYKVEYTGEWPVSCSGDLVIYKDDNEIYRTKPYSFSSGGSCGFMNGFADEYVNKGSLLFRSDEEKKQLRDFCLTQESRIELYDECLKVITEYGGCCCGGCL